MLFIHQGIAEVETLDITEYLPVHISTAENQDFRVVESGCVTTAPVRVLPGWVNAYPGVLVYIKQVDIHKYSGRLTTPDNTEMWLIYPGSGMTSSWGGRLLTGHRRQQPTPGCNIKNEHIIEKLVYVSSGKHIEVAISSQVTEMHKGTTGAGGRYSHWPLYIILYFMPHHFCEIEVVHVVIEVSQIRPAKNPHLMSLLRICSNN